MNRKFLSEHSVNRNRRSHLNFESVDDNLVFYNYEKQLENGVDPASIVVLLSRNFDKSHLQLKVAWYNFIDAYLPHCRKIAALYRRVDLALLSLKGKLFSVILSYL